MNFTDPKTAAQRLGLRVGMKVGDFGVGSGHYTLAVAPLVGTEGRVYAIDVQQDVLTRVRGLAEERHILNIETVWGNFEKAFGTKLRDHVLDAAILSNTLFQLDDRSTAIIEIKRTLVSGGRLLVIDWAGTYSGMGPAADRLIPAHDAEALFIGAGFHKVESFAAGPHHYGIIFTAP
ncbi:MAG: hypothetical protein B7X04_03580 [Parcubacteria group bacterium 21-54-25]|nr:MAG: hypothetical protein B7X04_03580 [Parcubacteria group bacterium 21-54-25]HQU08067.1 methyltransferase domain-containing protein [Candidatus Paceibacterota bacterium]